MGYELIITEKPQAAKKIAEALAQTKPVKKSVSSVPYYILSRDGRKICVGCAVGHLFTVAEKNKSGWKYPVFDVEWVPTSKAGKGASYSAKYEKVLRTLSKDADSFTVACDFDIEGEVIGYNVVKHICRQGDARRMKFSTLTRSDLQKAYDNVSASLEWGQVNAGVTRHELDWYYGINLSRALTHAVKTAGMFKILSSGRVQGPALRIIVEREKEIKKFVPVPYWEVHLHCKISGQSLTALHEQDKFWDRAGAEGVMGRVQGKDGTVSEVARNTFAQPPPVPFDLTTLQTESYRTLRIQPKKTLEFAQELYIAGLISYPRTSSQKLPPEIGYREILGRIREQAFYRELAEKVLSFPGLTPAQGKKTDPAHPAIYPTGFIAKIDGQKARLYDLIMRRFLSAFAQPAARETVQIKIDVDSEIFLAKGTRTVEPGWHVFYGPHLRLEEEEMPPAKEGDTAPVENAQMLEKATQPPKRYTPASIIRELEKKNLGTKATRAQIVESLFQRGYVHETSIQATDLGIHTCGTLERHSPEILDEELTRTFEEYMEDIRENKKTKDEVLALAREKLTIILDNFRQKEAEIGKELAEALRMTREKLDTVGRCPKCEGSLEIRRGKFGKFIACSGYPGCSVTFKLPAGNIKVTDELCRDCGFPQVIISRGRRPQTVCINENCPAKKPADPDVKREMEEISNGTVEKECPKCGKPLVLRTSIYGKFLGCSGFPKCRHTERISNGPLKEDFGAK